MHGASPSARSVRSSGLEQGLRDDAAEIEHQCLGKRPRHATAPWRGLPGRCPPRPIGRRSASTVPLNAVLLMWSLISCNSTGARTADRHGVDESGEGVGIVQRLAIAVPLLDAAGRLHEGNRCAGAEYGCAAIAPAIRAAIGRDPRRRRGEQPVVRVERTIGQLLRLPQAGPGSPPCRPARGDDLAECRLGPASSRSAPELTTEPVSWLATSCRLDPAPLQLLRWAIDSIAAAAHAGGVEDDHLKPRRSAAAGSTM